jgi:hypothetical protein
VVAEGEGTRLNARERAGPKSRPRSSIYDCCPTQWQRSRRQHETRNHYAARERGEQRAEHTSKAVTANSQDPVAAIERARSPPSVLGRLQRLRRSGKRKQDKQEGVESFQRSTLHLPRTRYVPSDRLRMVYR